MSTASASSKKRKTLHDYFSSSSTSSDQSLNTSSKAVPPGLRVFQDFVNGEQEKQLLDFLDAQSWRTDLSRRTMHYGGTYCLMPPRGASAEERKQVEQTIITAHPIPDELGFVVDLMIKHNLYTPESRPQYCIVNEYLHGQGISAHVENFRFDEPVCSLTLAGGDYMRFHELRSAHDGSVRSGKASTAPRTGVRKDVWLERRSLAVLTGDARSKWQHEIVRGRKTGKLDG